ncbi:hypothetical protein IMZ29_04195 [Achromobacter sp. GG226]|uniref:hypothetical protein n=1 Tax=Verticiella alkaliphila TaxID=2779529 RepID=UPI001C0CB27A|nr:hypothetical protein [Verticiella sp. GG226]MBU4609775.1 hypothetical protein [Verticiella sp. GG226]
MTGSTLTLEAPAQDEALTDAQLDAVCGAGWLDDFVDAIKPKGLRIKYHPY